MAKRKVTDVTEIRYQNMQYEELNYVFHLNDLRAEWEATSFDIEGDDFVCLRDLDDGTDNHDGNAYAVYLKSTGELICLVADSGMALDGMEDEDYCHERNELYKQIAMLAGWPESMYDLSFQMTWRQLIDKLKDFPKEFLDTPAYAWRPDNVGLVAVRGVEPWFYRYDGTVPGPGRPDYNCYYVNVEEDVE